MLRPLNPPNPDAQNFQCKFKLNQNLDLNQRDTEESEFLDLVDFGDVAFSMETAIATGSGDSRHVSK